MSVTILINEHTCRSITALLKVIVIKFKICVKLYLIKLPKPNRMQLTNQRCTQDLLPQRAERIPTRAAASSDGLAESTDLLSIISFIEHGPRLQHLS